MAYRANELNSYQLLALLLLCESERKGVEAAKIYKSPDWEEFLNIFASRIGHMNESGRFEVLEAHLMSVEDIDLYNDEIIGALLEKHDSSLPTMAKQIEEDPRIKLI